MQVKLSQGYVECLQPQFKQLDSVLDLNIVVNCYDDNPTILLFLRNTRADKATANADGRTDGESANADGRTDGESANADGRTDGETANADGRTDGKAISADGETNTGSTDTAKSSN